MKAKTIFGILVLLMASLGQGQLVIKENTAVSLPVILIDDTDFKSQETGVGGGSVTVKHKHAADSSWTTKDVSGSGWDEIGDGVYEIDFNTSDIGSESATNQGIFLYMVEGTGYLTYYGSAQMIPQSLKESEDDINAILTDTNDIETDLNDGVALTSATETQIDNIEADTNEIQGNQSNFITATGFSTLTASDNIGINWADISNPTTEVDLSGTNISTVDTCSALTANNDKTGYGLANDAITAAKIAANAIGSSEIATGAIDADSIAANAFTAAKFASDFWTTLQDYVWNETTRLITGFTASWIDSEAISEAELNASHGTGLYNTSTSCASTSDVNNARDNIKANVTAEHTATKAHGDSNWGAGAVDNKSEIYDYFISGSNEDQFKANVSSLPTGDEIWQREIDDDKNVTAEEALNDTYHSIFSWGGSGW